MNNDNIVYMVMRVHKDHRGKRTQYYGICTVWMERPVHAEHFSKKEDAETRLAYAQRYYPESVCFVGPIELNESLL